MKFTIEDLLNAYKKVKIDIFYDRNNDDLIPFVEFESNLIGNLNEIQKALNSRNMEFFLNEEVIGSYSVALKEVDFKFSKELGFIVNDFEKAKKAENCNVKWRYVGKNSVIFHVISSLWIEKIGRYFDGELSDSCYGCRINYSMGDNSKVSFDTNGDFPIHGNFKPYAYDYKQWQSRALKVSLDAINKDKNIAVFSTDLKSFYHSINPEVLRSLFENNKFNNHFINDLLCEMLIYWDRTVKNKIKKLGFVLPNEETAGIPIGLSASKVIANVVLQSLDKSILSNLTPLYYGRYVDDILLVFDNSFNFQTKQDVWRVFSKGVDEIILNFGNDNSEIVRYQENSLISFVFSEEKTKLFTFSSKSGSIALEALEKSMNDNSSEWRLMPDGEGDLESLNTDIINSKGGCDERVNSFSKFDGVSVQRFKFALRLRNFESLVVNFSEEVWGKDLDSFYETIIEHVFTPQSLGKYIRYFPRIFGLLTFANRTELFQKVSNRYNECWRLIESKYIAYDNSDDRGNHQRRHNVIIELEKYYSNLISENIKCSFPLTESNINRSINAHNNFYTYENEYLNHLDIFFSDFHRVPLKRMFFDSKYKHIYQNVFKNKKLKEKNIVNQSNSWADSNNRLDNLLIELNIYSINSSNLFLSTRKLTPIELSLISKFYLDKEREQLFNFLLSYFGYDLEPPLNSEFHGISNFRYMDFGNESDEDPYIVLTNFSTQDKSWIANVREDDYEPDSHREIRLNRIVNDILKIKKKIDYVVFPELSIPRQRMLDIADRFRTKGISLIGGVEYEISDDNNLLLNENFNPKNVKYVRNQLFYAITRRESNYYSQFCILQDKTIPAFHEERELFDVGAKVLSPESETKFIVKHNSHFFSGMICNDLLNIDNRQPLRGKIDTLFVLEWNKDTDMYNHIVSTTSNDLHCFVAQVNNREYGDTKLRGPYKDKFRRDIAMIKGGDLDNFVLVKIEADALRDFQRYHRSPDMPFKPVPTGFQMSEERRYTRLKK